MYRMGQEEIDAVARVINSKQLFKVNSGELQETANCEKEMREYFGTRHTVLMTSGMAALVSALVGMGIGPGDEVIIPAYTYIATAIAVVSAGAMPVVAEIDDSLMIDPEDIERKITERTKAIIPVHMEGYVCDMDRIMAIAKKYGLKVLEDACQCVGGSFGGKHVGTIGDAGAFSFNYFKNISAGEGGALLTDDKTIFEKGLIYHDSSAVAYFGDQMKEFSAETFCGSEFRTNEITAAILRVQLTRLDGILADLRNYKNRLKEMLSPYCEFAPSNDEKGECSNKLTIKFGSEEQASEFCKKANGGAYAPILLGKHVYNDWAPIINRRGAAHPLMNPFEMKENKEFKFDVDMCPKSLEILRTNVHVIINPDWKENEFEARAKELIDALK